MVAAGKNSLIVEGNCSKRVPESTAHWVAEAIAQEESVSAAVKAPCIDQIVTSAYNRQSLSRLCLATVVGRSAPATESAVCK